MSELDIEDVSRTAAHIGAPLLEEYVDLIDTHGQRFATAVAFDVCGHLLAMALSSVFVVANSLRLRGFRSRRK